MNRVQIVVEGSTEEAFVKRLLVEPLAAKSVFLSPMRVLRGGGARGGGSRWQPWEKHIGGLLKQDSSRDLRVSMLLDLYRIPKDTPGYLPPSGDGAGRADAMLSALRGRFADDRFIPYLQVHEFEALLFVDLGALNRVDPEGFRAEELESLAHSVSHLEPEAIDEGGETAPSKRVLDRFPMFEKVEHGVAATLSIGLDRLRTRCPRFGAWVSCLEALGDTES